MRLELGRRADYAIRAMIDLARHHSNGERRKARAIAEEMAIPGNFIGQILADLVRAGLADSVAGPLGGYRLGSDPADVDVLAVIEAVEGPPESTVCVLRGGPCRWDGICAVHVPWYEAQRAMLDRLQATTFAELITIDASLDAGTFSLPEHLLVVTDNAG